MCTQGWCFEQISVHKVGVLNKLFMFRRDVLFLLCLHLMDNALKTYFEGGT